MVFSVIILDYPILTICVVRKQVETIGKVDDKKDFKNTKMILLFSRLGDESTKYREKPVQLV